MPSSRTRHAADESSLCQFPFADGRTCRMLRYHAHPTLCVVHARREQDLIDHELQLRDLKNITAELASLSGSFHSVSDIHHVMGKLFHLVAANRIPRRHAQLLIAIAKLLLHGQDQVRQEFTDVRGFKEWDAMLRQIYPIDTPPHRATAQASNPDEGREEQDDVGSDSGGRAA